MLKSLQASARLTWEENVKLRKEINDQKFEVSRQKLLCQKKIDAAREEVRALFDEQQRRTVKGDYFRAWLGSVVKTRAELREAFLLRGIGNHDGCGGVPVVGKIGEGLVGAGGNVSTLAHLRGVLGRYASNREGDGQEKGINSSTRAYRGRDASRVYSATQQKQSGAGRRTARVPSPSPARLNVLELVLSRWRLLVTHRGALDHHHAQEQELTQLKERVNRLLREKADLQNQNNELLFERKSWHADREYDLKKPEQEKQALRALLAEKNEEVVCGDGLVCPQVCVKYFKCVMCVMCVRCVKCVKSVKSVSCVLCVMCP